MLDLQNLKSTAEKNKLANEAAYTAWVESHSVQTIMAANKARARLSRAYNIASRRIRDPRIPKRSRNAFSFFLESRFQSGVERGSTAVDNMKDLGRQWASMPDFQKQVR